MTAAYPLTWPVGRPRTSARGPALFRANRNGGRVPFDMARDRVERQLSRLVDVSNVILSMNVRLTLSGRRDMALSRGEPADPGAALYFDMGGRPHVLACDRWDRVADNIAAIAAHIDALLGQERWGVADLRQAFAGHVALPPPEGWWQVLGLAPEAGVAEIDRAWRAAIAAAHPDRGGSEAAAARINAARDAGLRARR